MGMIYIDFDKDYEIIKTGFIHDLYRLNINNKEIINIRYIKDAGIVECETKNENVCDIVMPQGFEVVGYTPKQAIVQKNDEIEGQINAKLSFSGNNESSARLTSHAYPYHRIFSEKEYLLENVCLNTEKLVGDNIPNEVSRALTYLFFDNDFSYFSNIDGLKDKLKKQVKSTDLLSIMYSTLTKKGILPSKNEKSYVISLINDYCSYIKNIKEEEKITNNDNKLVYKQ